MAAYRKEFEMDRMISDVVYLICRKIVWILLIATLFAAGGYLWSVTTYQPAFFATSSLIVNPTKLTGATAADSTIDINLAKSLVPTYTAVLKSNRVMQYVVNELNLRTSKETLRSYVSLSSQEGTQILYMTVTCPDPQMAIDISNAIVAVAPKALMETLQIGTVNVLDAAFISGMVANDEIKDTVKAGIVGVGAGLLFVMLWGMLSSRIRNNGDVEESLGLQVIGEVEHVRRRKARKNLLLSATAVPPKFIESFMMLGAVVDHLLSAQNMKRLLVTGALENEGKSMVSVNLALALANSGKNVLLIDCDLRKPNVSRMLGIEKGEAAVFYGIFEYEKDLKECVSEVYPGLSVIPFINRLDKRQILFRSKNFAKTIDALSKRYDYIIYDTAPMYDVNDTLNLIGLADAVLLVIRQENTPVKTLSKVVDTLSRVNARVLGCVLNDIKYVSASTKYSRKYKYHYDFQYQIPVEEGNVPMKAEIKAVN